MRMSVQKEKGQRIRMTQHVKTLLIENSFFALIDGPIYRRTRLLMMDIGGEANNVAAATFTLFARQF